MKDRTIGNSVSNENFTPPTQHGHHRVRRRNQHSQTLSSSSPYHSSTYSTAMMRPSNNDDTTNLYHRTRRESISDENNKNDPTPVTPSFAFEENFEIFQHQFQYSNSPPGYCKFPAFAFQCLTSGFYFQRIRSLLVLK